MFSVSRSTHSRLVQQLRRLLEVVAAAAQWQVAVHMGLQSSNQSSGEWNDRQQHSTQSRTRSESMDQRPIDIETFYLPSASALNRLRDSLRCLLDWFESAQHNRASVVHDKHNEVAKPTTSLGAADKGAAATEAGKIAPHRVASVAEPVMHLFLPCTSANRGTQSDRAGRVITAPLG